MRIKRSREETRTSEQWRFVTQTIVPILCIEMHLSLVYVCVHLWPPFKFPYVSCFLSLLFVCSLFILLTPRFLLFVIHSIGIFVWSLAVVWKWWWWWWHIAPPQPHFRCHKFSFSIKCLNHKNKPQKNHDVRMHV